MTKRGARVFKFGLIMAALFIYSSFSVVAQTVAPEGPDTINISHSDRGTENSQGLDVAAQAGNVTGLVISQQVLTKSWQGYYGNITGSIVLEDAAANRFYDWQITNPEGEIYAVNGSTTPIWTSVYCLNVTQNEGYGTGGTNDPLPITRPSGSVSSINSTQIEFDYGINLSDNDGLNETFYDFYTSTTGFTVADVTIDNTDGCSLAHPYESSTLNANSWQQLILSDNVTLIFTSLIREDQTSYDSGKTADFQMLVLEDGHTQQADIASTYRFYLELS